MADVLSVEWELMQQDKLLLQVTRKNGRRFKKNQLPNRFDGQFFKRLN